MTHRMDFLASRITRLLDALDPPRGITEQGRIDETGALLRAADRAAPSNGYEGWWPRFEDALREGMRGRTWPTPGDVARAAKGIPAPKQSRPIGAEDLDWQEEAKRKQLADWITGRRDNEGKPVVRGIPAGLVTPARLAAIGVTGHDAARAIAFANDPENHGIGPWRQEERRRDIERGYAA